MPLMPPSTQACHAAIVTVDCDALRHNFSLLHDLRVAAQGPAPMAVSGVTLPPLMPVVKADGYGHGYMEVSLTLCRAGATALASGSVQEAALLREGLAAHGLFPEIVSLLGPVWPEDWSLAASHSIIPVVHSFEQLDVLELAVGGQGMRPPSRALFAADAARPLLPVAVKCNSGMSRLGFNEKELPVLLERLKSLSHRICKGMEKGIVPILAVSHFAGSDMPDGPAQIERQATIFARMLGVLRSEYPVAASLCNSAATFLGEYMDPIVGPQVCRPGLAIYGCNPLKGTPFEERGQGLRPVMSVQTPIIAMRTLGSGDGIGYGHTWTASSETSVGILAAGYADGFSRGLSNKGRVCVGGVRADVIGRVSMQMTAVDFGPALAAGVALCPGNYVDILGGEGAGALSADDLARLWGTISYEVLCLLGMNARRYVGF